MKGLHPLISAYGNRVLPRAHLVEGEMRFLGATVDEDGSVKPDEGSFAYCNDYYIELSPDLHTATSYAIAVLREYAEAAPTEAGVKGTPEETRSPERGQTTRGRKPLGADEERRRNDILEAWAEAKEAGVSQAEFCEDWNDSHPDENLTEIEVQKIQSWKAQRKRRKSGRT
jgi:hypothetical protein